MLHKIMFYDTQLFSKAHANYYMKTNIIWGETKFSEAQNLCILITPKNW